MVQIVTVTPDRFRPGDQITIDGLSFSPTPGQNRVAIGGVETSVFSESDTQIVADVPGGTPVDQFVAVQVQRVDTFDNDARSFFCSGSLSDLRDGTVEAPGQSPGAIEAANLSVLVEDVPQAQDYERMATFAEYLLREIFTSAGDVFASDGALPMTRFGVGAAGLVLEADPGQPLGLFYSAAPAGRITLSWGKRIDAGAANNGAMVAGGDSDNPSVLAGDHGCGVAGTVDRITVLVQEASGGDTLDQVQLALNGVVAYDSLGGLGITQGNSHTANPAVAVVAGDRLEIRAFKAGVGGIMRLRGQVGF